MHYHHLLTGKGWIKKKCSSCSGNSKNTYTHPQRAGEEIVIYKLSKVFRYKKNGIIISGGSVDSLRYQHFTQ